MRPKIVSINKTLYSLMQFTKSDVAEVQVFESTNENMSVCLLVFFNRFLALVCILRDVNFEKKGLCSEVF